jgi:drug/metabolite transporter (DMT)-like permease
MTLLCIILIASSAIMHASWNLICKSQNPSAAFFLVSTTASILVTSPLTFYYLPIIAKFPTSVWILLLTTGFVQAIYYTCLGNAYKLSEISIAYPIAKALPVLFVPAVTIALSLGKQLTPMAIFGMLLVCIGCIILPMPSFRSISWKQLCNKSFIFIFGAALATTAYTVIDSEALKRCHEINLAGYIPIAIAYLALENILIEIFLIPYIFTNKSERLILAKMIRKNMLRYPLICGVVCTVSYLQVLLAMTMANNVSYIAAFRQLSIPLGAVLGIVILKESFTHPKLSGISLIFLGLILVGLC